MYIGKTNESDVKIRWAYHIRFLCYGKHYNAHLQRSWNKYGSENFLFEVLDVSLSPHDLSVLERHWISRFQTNVPNFGYNKTAGGDGLSKGFKHSEETIKKFKARTGNKNGFFGRKHSEISLEKMTKVKIGKSPGNRRQVFCVTNGRLYQSVDSAAKNLGCFCSNVYKVCTGERLQTNGLKFIFVDSKRTV
jgi:group I intron endonuclease